MYVWVKRFLQNYCMGDLGAFFIYIFADTWATDFKFAAALDLRLMVYLTKKWLSVQYDWFCHGRSHMMLHSYHLTISLLGHLNIMCIYACSHGCKLWWGTFKVICNDCWQRGKACRKHTSVFRLEITAICQSPVSFASIVVPSASKWSLFLQKQLLMWHPSY